MSISIRELGLTDEAMVIELLDTITPDWQDAMAPGASGPRAYMADPKTFMFGGYVDNEPAGWLWGSHLRRPDGRQMSYIHQIDVRPLHRRQGLASMLLEAAIGLTRRNGSHRAWLVTAVDNDPANELYRSLGGELMQRESDQRVYRWSL